eukprot:scaffold329076_cov106-Tisochrysis_lutea.AAC.1
MGVFVGIWASEYSEVMSRNGHLTSGYAPTALGCSMAAGRLSFALGLQGPCLSIDTACSSGLVAAHTSLRSLERSESVAALSCGIGMIFSQ